MFFAGDLNINLRAKTRQLMLFSDLIQSFQVKPTISDITRISENGGSCLDNILTNMPDCLYVSTTVHTCLSDHEAQVLSFSSSTKHSQIKPQKTSSRIYSSKNKTKFRQFLQNENWYTVTKMKSVNEQFIEFTEIFTNYFNLSFPVVEKTCNRSSKPKWLTREVRESRDRLHDAYILQLTGPPELKEYYKSLKRLHKQLILQTKSRQAAESIAGSRNPVKATWNIINSCRPSHQQTDRGVSELEYEDKTVTSPSEIATILNKTFIDVAENLNNSPSSKQRDRPIDLSGIQDNAHSFYFNEILL